MVRIQRPVPALPPRGRRVRYQRGIRKDLALRHRWAPGSRPPPVVSGLCRRPVFRAAWRFTLHTSDMRTRWPYRAYSEPRQDRVPHWTATGIACPLAVSAVHFAPKSGQRLRSCWRPKGRQAHSGAVPRPPVWGGGHRCSGGCREVNTDTTSTLVTAGRLHSIRHSSAIRTSSVRKVVVSFGT